MVCCVYALATLLFCGSSIFLLNIFLFINSYISPGASVQIWNKIFNKKDIMWEAEYVEECLEESKKKGLLDGMNIVVGDQANIPTLRKWIQETGGDFDIIVDDGNIGLLFSVLCLV